MQLTPDQLNRATGCGALRAAHFCGELNAAMLRFKIDTAQRTAHFLAQVVVESGNFSRLEENLNYSAERLCVVWPSRFKSVADAAPYARNSEALANNVYAGRLGNTQPGDGWRYRGRGLKQLTGRANYAAYYSYSGVDVVAHPEFLLEPLQAAYSAGWFWKTNGCSALADAGDVRGLTQRINGGLTGLAEREAATKRALAALAG
jgi:putative chitinase